VTEIDYMKDYQDFLIYKVLYLNMKDFTDYLVSLHKKFVSINDAGIARTPGYFAYDNGVKLDAFIKSGRNTSNFLQGIVWPGYAYYTDFYNPAALKFWKDNLRHNFFPFLMEYELI